MRVCVLVLLLAGAAAADSSVPATSAPAATCNWESTRYGHFVQSDAVKKAKVPNGVYFMQAGRRHFLFGDHWVGKKPRTVVWDPVTERVVLEVAAAPGALVEAADGSLRGVLLVKKDGLQFDKVSIKTGTLYYDSASVVLEGEGCTAYIGLFDRIATGSSLISANLCTGAVRWTADVVQLNVAHSKYFNDVTVEKRGDEILMHGVEAAGCYEQAFDAATGARKRSSIQRR